MTYFISQSDDDWEALSAWADFAWGGFDLERREIGFGGLMARSTFISLLGNFVDKFPFFLYICVAGDP